MLRLADKSQDALAPIKEKPSRNKAFKRVNTNIVWFDGDKKKELLEKQIDVTKLSFYTKEEILKRPLKTYLDKSKGYYEDGYNMVTHQEYGDLRSGMKRMENGSISEEKRFNIYDT